MVLWGVLIQVGLRAKYSTGGVDVKCTDHEWNTLRTKWLLSLKPWTHQTNTWTSDTHSAEGEWESFLSWRRAETRSSSPTTRQCCPVCSCERSRFYNCTRRPALGGKPVNELGGVEKHRRAQAPPTPRAADSLLYCCERPSDSSVHDSSRQQGGEDGVGWGGGGAELIENQQLLLRQWARYIYMNAVWATV